MCLDDKVEVRLADHTPNVAADFGGQRGLFSKRRLASSEVLTSSPAVPVHREELLEETPVDHAKYEQRQQRAARQGGRGDPAERRQALLLNYMFGHPESSLLWLSQAPLVLAVNHATHGEKQPNAEFRWHHDEYTDAQAAGTPLTRRQQFHHAELLGTNITDFVHQNGLGLMIDLVATQTIEPGEEILVDYGKEWDAAMKMHSGAWAATVVSQELENQRNKERRKLERKQQRKNGHVPHDATHIKHKQRGTENAMTAVPFSSYETAADFNRLHGSDDIRTVSEQRRNPYPSNLETACWFETDWLDDDIDADLHAEKITYDSWYHHVDRTCLLPCIVTERRDYVPGEEKELAADDYDYAHDAAKPAADAVGGADDHGGSATPRRYTAKLVDTAPDNISILVDCHLYERFEYIYMDIPRESIVFVNKLHSTDRWIEQSFRHPIGLPETMVPAIWRDLARPQDQKGKVGGMRGSRPKQSTLKAEAGKQPPVVRKKTLTKEEEEKEQEYRSSTRRWNNVETRRERLELMEEKRITDVWPGEEI